MEKQTPTGNENKERFDRDLAELKKSVNEFDIFETYCQGVFLLQEPALFHGTSHRQLGAMGYIPGMLEEARPKVKGPMNCPVCCSSDTKGLYREPGAMVIETGRKFELSVAWCRSCDLLFQSGAYLDGYDEVFAEAYESYRKNDHLGFPRRSKDNLEFCEFIVKHLAPWPVPRVLEIGAGRGDLLYLLQEKLPQASLIGIDPAAGHDSRVSIIKGFFRPELFDRRFDAVILHHVLEHIKYPARFIGEVRSVLKDDGVLLVEVPDALSGLRHLTEEHILEHVSYFSLASLGRLLDSFTLIERSACPFIRTAWRPGPASRFTRETSSEDLGAWSQKYLSQKQRLTAAMIDHWTEGGRIVFYGIGRYFRLLFLYLQAATGSLERCFFTEDGSGAEFEPTWKLPRVDVIKAGDLVVTCSNLHHVQEAISDRLGRVRGIKVLRPWSGLVEY